MVSLSWQTRPGEKRREPVVRSGRRNDNLPLREQTNSILNSRESGVNFCSSSPLVAWAESFIFAGSSALLLLLANIFPQYWYFPFFALVPFLFRIINATPTESLRLGILLGISFFAVSVTVSLPISPIPSILKFLLGTGFFTVFGWTVGWARKHWGFNPSIVAVLWVGLEIGLVKLGFVGGLLGSSEFSNPFLHSIVGLFGFLAVSALIVLLNSFLVLATIKALKLTKTIPQIAHKEKRSWEYIFTCNFSTQKVYIVPEGRAPPYHQFARPCYEM